MDGGFQSSTVLVSHARKGSALLAVVGLIAFFTVLLVKLDRQVLVAHEALCAAIKVGFKEIMIDSCMRHTLLFCQRHADEFIKNRHSGAVELEYSLDAVHSCSVIITANNDLQTIKAELYRHEELEAVGEVVLAIRHGRLGKNFFMVRSYDIH